MSISVDFLSKMDDNSTSSTENLCDSVKKKLVLSEKVEEKVEEIKRDDDDDEEKIEEKVPTTLSEWCEVARIKLKDVKGDWNERSACLKLLQDLCKSDAIGKDEFAGEENRDILLPLMKTQLLDLRSAVMREACNTVQVMSEHSRTNLGPFVLSLFATFVDRSACGNKVISRYARSALLAIVENSRPENAVDSCLEYIVRSKNKKVREVAMRVASVVIRCYESCDIDVVKNLLTKGQADAAIEVREATRECFDVFRKRFTDEAETFLLGLSKKVKERLEKKTPSVRRKVRVRSGRGRKFTGRSRKRLISNGSVGSSKKKSETVAATTTDDDGVAR